MVAQDYHIAQRDWYHSVYHCYYHFSPHIRNFIYLCFLATGIADSLRTTKSDKCCWLGKVHASCAQVGLFDSALGGYGADLVTRVVSSTIQITLDEL